MKGAMTKEDFESHLRRSASSGPAESVANGHGAATFYPPYYQKGCGLPAYVKEGDIEYPFEDTTGVGDENKIRGNWSSQVDFVLACLGFVVGLSNLWRFPNYCYTNGGAAFLIPYFIMLILVGMPMFFMEISLGQFASLGCVSVWKVCPLFKGIGFAMFIVSCYIGVYYNVLTSWAIYYLVNSVRTSVPWASCGNQWNTPRQCSSWTRSDLEACARDNGTLLGNGSCLFASDLDDMLEVFGNRSDLAIFADPSQANRTLPSQEYFNFMVLQRSSGIDDIGTIHWQLALYLLIAWLLIFFCTFKSIKTSGKVVYMTAVAPYIILLVLLVRALTLPGSLNGLIYFFQPDWQKLLEVKVWGEAAAQVFYSLSSCWGGLITLASYNRFHNDCIRDAWVVGVASALTSVLAACVTFATVGYMCHERMEELSFGARLLHDGPSVAFVVYAEALSRLPVAPIWSILFFSMLIMLAIDTQLVIVETVVTSVCDEFAERLRRNHRHVLMFVCAAFYCAGVALCTQAGAYMIHLADAFVPTHALLVLAFVQAMIVAWVYGVDNLLDNIKWMVRHYPQPYILWKFMWKLFTPVALLAILTFTWVEYKPLRYGDYPYPQLAITIGWLGSFSSVIAIPLVALYRICWAKGSFMQRLQELLSPSEDWGPALAVHRAEQYPLQIPEARYPVAAASDGGGGDAVPRSSSTVSADARRPLLDDDTPPAVAFVRGAASQERNSAAPAAPDVLPSFDRETAI